MKKTLIILIAPIIFMACMSNPKAKAYECKEYSQECEYKKDRVLIRPLAVEASALDAYGEQIDTSKWYIVSTKTSTLGRVLAPTSYSVCTHVNVDGASTYEDQPGYDLIIKSLHGIDKNIRIDTVDRPGLADGLKKFAIVVLGPNEIVCSTFDHSSSIAVSENN